MAGTPTSSSTPHSVDPFARMPWRRRLLVGLLALSTAITVLYLVLEKPGGVKQPPAALRHTAEPPRCASETAASAARAGAPTDCVGAMTRVLPAAPR